MKFTKKWKQFCALNQHHAEGFTLVELIVVIAILAILAGVAVPAYNGYIAKANKAADDAILSAVNRAFAAACLQEGESHIGQSNVVLVYTKNGPVTDVTIGGASLPNFNALYAGNEDAHITYYDEINYDSETGMFIGNPDGEGSGSSFEASEELLNAYKGSIFNSIGTEKLTGQVDTLADILSKTADGELSVLVESGPFQELLAQTGAFDQYVKEDGTFDKAQLQADMKEKPELAQKVANASVLLVAKATEGLTADQILTAIEQDNTGSGNLDRLLATNGITGSDGTFVELALKYGMMYGYYNSKDTTSDYANAFNSATIDGKNSVESLYTNASDDGDFLDYLERFEGTGSTAEADMEGFLAALDIINSNVSSGNVNLDDMDQDGFFSGFTGDIDGLLGK